MSADWQPIETAPKQEGIDLLLWHGRANVGGWFPRWDYDWKAGDATDCWVINGGFVVTPTHWQPVSPPLQEAER